MRVWIILNIYFFLKIESHFEKYNSLQKNLQMRKSLNYWRYSESFIEIILFLGIVIASTILLLNFTNLNNIFITMSAFAIATIRAVPALNSLFSNYV